MHRPEEGDRQRQRCRGGAMPFAQRRLQQGAPHDAEERERPEQVDAKVEDMIAPDADAAEGVVDRQREIDHRTPSHRLPSFARRRQHIAQG